MRAANGEAVGEVVEGAFFQVSGRLHIGRHVPPEPFEQRSELLAVGLAEVFPEVRLHGTLVLVVGSSNHRDVDAELLEHAWVEHALAAKAVQGHAALGVQVHLVRGSVEVQRALAHGFRPRHDELVAVLQNFQPRAEILHHGWHDRNVGHVEQNAFDLIVLCGALKSVQDLVEAHLHVGFQSTQAKRKRHVVAASLHNG